MAITATPRTTPKPETDLKNVIIDEEAGTFSASIFGERFTFSTGVNGFLMFMATTGKADNFLKLIHSLIMVEGDFETEAKLEAAREAEKERFADLLGRQPGEEFGMEAFFRLVNDIIETAGNDPTAS